MLAPICLLRDALSWRARRFLRVIQRGPKPVRWHGDYSSWQAAASASSGYSSDAIVARCASASEMVHQGMAAYERDGVAFERAWYSWPLVASLMLATLRSGGTLRVLDFGGALGSTFNHNAPLLSCATELRWAVVEQPGFVKCGNGRFSSEQLRFFETVAAAAEWVEPNLVLASSVFQYLPSPDAVIEELVSVGSEFLLIDRTGFARGGERITVQTVPAWICEASYPCRFFKESEFLTKFEGDYEVLYSFDALDEANIPSYYKGFMMEKRKKPLTA